MIKGGKEEGAVRWRRDWSGKGGREEEVVAASESESL